MRLNRLTRSGEKEELAKFLRFCRERISPEQLGLPATRRRRTKGLRREEVATLAGVGLTWYTWFEQGRDIQVSDDFLLRLSRGLRLNRAEQEHLFALSQRQAVRAIAPAIDLPPSLIGIVKRLPDAAYVLDNCWDVLAYNDAALTLFEDLAADRPNMLRIVFFSNAYRQKIRDWSFAARLVFLKARHDFLTGGRSPILESLLDDVMGASPEAKEWWNDPEALRIGDTKIELNDPLTGWITFQLSIFSYEDHPNLRLVVYTNEHCSPFTDDQN
ncbi:helix-turn-helix domain-containing protein [Thalassospira marina]|uniref:MmyB family transcriptional regulator n=1 Tax=Thalassospira marina TaxID=2048283 RepID=UPI0012FEE695|nr:helix-turn-helix domain-containing protein [Thalassospira marina]